MDFRIQNIKSIQDIRAIIHSLKMSNLAFVEPDANEELQQMIKALPSTEVLLTLGKEEIRKIRDDIKSILQIADSYSKNNKEYEVRYKTKTGLPPRYRITDLASAKTMDAIYKVSSSLDGQGYHKLAANVMTCAKKVSDDSFFGSDFLDTSRALVTAGFEKEALMLIEGAISPAQQAAQRWDKKRKRGPSNPVNDGGRKVDQAKIQQLRTEMTDWISAAKEFKTNVQQLQADLYLPESQQQCDRFISVLDQLIATGANGIEALSAPYKAPAVAAETTVAPAETTVAPAETASAPAETASAPAVETTETTTVPTTKPKPAGKPFASLSPAEQTARRRDQRLKRDKDEYDRPTTYTYQDKNNMPVSLAVQYVTDPDDSKYEIAYIAAGREKYRLTRDNKGKLIPMQFTPQEKAKYFPPKKKAPIAPKPFDPSTFNPNTLDANTIDQIFAEFGVTSKSGTFRIIRMGAALDPNFSAYLKDLAKSNPASFASLIKQLKVRKAELAKSAPVSPESGPVAHVDNPPSDNPVKSLESPEATSRRLEQAKSVFPIIALS